MRTAFGRRGLGLGLGVAALAAGLTLACARPSSAAVEPPFPPPKVPLAFNRLYDYPDLVAAMRKLAEGHPDIISMSSLGKSVEGRDLWCLTINNPATGPDRSKPAMYVDGNVHGNEVQAAEACLYLAWYLAENRGRVEELRRIVDERAFYIVPTVNPDGRAYWFGGPNTTHSSRSGKTPRDDDGDGLLDEDGYEDLDGDGQVTQMRRKAAHGRWKVSAADPRLMVPAGPGEDGQYELLGTEGRDDDGDGEVNEDPPGGYDMNRDWPADWRPSHDQSGAGDFPLSWPETRALAEFILARPNIAGVQSFHNAGGMILRGPGHPSRQPQYPSADDRVADQIGRMGARMLPYYRNMVIHRDLYPVRGGFINWTYEHLGIFSFTNELWNNDQLMPRAEPAQAPGSTLGSAVGADDEDRQLLANDRLLFGTQFRPWKAARHPVYGEIEIGGFVKQSQRVPPPFMIEEMCHRNAAFVLYHADQMPRLEWDGASVAPLGGDAFSVTASVRNTRSIPSVARQASLRKIGLPDTFGLSGPGLTVVGGGTLVDRDTGRVEPAARNPGVLRLPEGIAGDSTARVRWFVRGRGEATLRYGSQKGGSLTKKIEIR
ncbi:M14 family metallopeptidase [Isosphaeraceae bacterium EP7]